MPRFFVAPGRCQGSLVTLDEGDSHHAVRVLRLEAGTLIEILDGAGRCLTARVARIDKRAVVAEVESVRTIPAPPAVRLAPALLKGRAMDFLVQKATELGVTELLPLVTSRTVAQVGPGEAEGKLAGWRSTAIEACKQCGNPWLPRLHPPISLVRFLELQVQRSGELLLVASLAEPARLPGDLWRGGQGPLPPVTLVLGPEGDFSPEELTALEQAGAIPITLGPLVLRAETAAIAALAVLQHELRWRGR